MVAGATTLSVLFFLSQVLQNVLGYSPLQAGIAFLPLGAGVVITAQVTSRLIGRTGPRIPIAAGALITAGGLAWLSRITAESSYATDILPALIALSVGLGLIFFPTTVVAVTGTSREDSGVASAVLNVSQQLGGSIGLAVLGAVAANVTKDNLVSQSIGQGLTAGFATAFEWAMVLALIGFVLSVALIRTPQPRVEVEALPDAA
jgi:predicted MFS family arabinose efflux permease